MRLAIVGEAPGRDGGPPLTGVKPNGASDRLRKMADVSMTRWRRARRVNLLPYVPDRWPSDEAAASVINLTESLLRGHRMILLGTRVARAFGIRWHLAPAQCYCEWMESDYGTVAVIPHPSGRNHAYNSEDMRRKVGKFVHDLLEKR